MRRLLAILLSLTFLLSLLAMPAGGALAAEARTFAETGKSVQGDFLAFFDAKGGLEIFGPPITDEIVEGGRTVQYFAKARFERWPENPPGFQVQLGLLAAQMGKVQPGIQADVSGDPQRRYFPETGHVLAFGFKEFWEQHGGVDVFGYPTTEQLVENGVIVQYTQRARFEWHPENAADKQIVLGDLGREYLGIAGPPTAAATQPAAVANDLLLFQQTAGGDIYTVKPDGSELRKVAHGLDPSWSADRTKIAYAQWDYPWGVYIADADGSNARQVQITSYPYGTRYPQSPVLSPDGRYVAFSEEYRDWRPVRPYFKDGKLVKEELKDLWRLLIVNLETGQAHIVVEQDFAVSPTWGPDGRLVFASRQGLYVLDEVETDRQVAQVAGTNPLFISPTWSPDGSMLASMWKQHDHYEIATMWADGSGFRVLTSSPVFTTPANNVAPSWSADGKSLAFLSNRTGKWQIWLMNADGSNQRMVDTGDLVLDYQFARERAVSWGK